jgi:hypothetical protein
VRSKVERNELLAVLHTNREKHRAIFEEAVEGYRKQTTEQLERCIARIKKGRLERVQINMPVPADQTREYERAIRMVEMTSESEIELSESDFASYVMDDWDWKRQFLSTNASYSRLAASLIPTDGHDW